MSRIDREKEILLLMIRLYCCKKHKQKYSICADCENLLQYAYARLSSCRFGEEKSSCRKCPIHCYKSDMRIRIKEIMRFSGPRMILYRPFEVIRHIFK